MKLSFAWPAPGGDEWSPEAAASLVGQKIKLDGIDGKVTECHLTDRGPLEVTIEVQDT